MKMKKTKLQKTGAKIGAMLTAGAIFISSLPGTMIYASAEADSGFSSAPQTELLDPLSASAAVSADSSASSLDLTQEAQSGQTDMPDQTSATALTDQTDVNQGDLTYEEDYIRQHLDFCDSEEYRTIMGTSGIFAQNIALAYQEAGLNAVNKTWDQLSSFFVFLGGGKVDDGLTNTLEITNKYDLIVSYLMQTTASEENFSASYEEAYLDATVEMLQEIKKLLGDTSSVAGKLSSGSLGKVEEIVTLIDQVLITIQDFKGTSKEAIQTCYQDALKQVKEKINQDFLKEDQDILKKGMLGLKALNAIASIGTETYSDVIDAFLLYRAGTQATDNWCSMWQEIADSARTSTTDESRLLAESITRILSEIRAAKEDMADSLIQKALTSGAGNTLLYGIQMASDAWDKTMGNWSVGKAIRDGLLSGVTVSNLVTNCDDIAYYGEMLISTGILATHGWNVLRDAEKTLKEKQDFASAAAFDEIFNIYKQIQIAACDYSINYYQAIATAPLSYIFKYTTGDEISATVQILAEKADWMAYHCHEEDTNVINNGGRFVSYRGNTYYWRFAPGSVEETGVLGSFNQVMTVKNDLICRTSDGEETVILQDTGSGPLFICGECIFYEKGYSSWGVCRLDGTPAASYDSAEIVAADTEHETVIASSYETGIFSIAADGTQANLAPVNSSFIGLHGIRVYYGIASENKMEVYSVRIDGLDQIFLGTIVLTDEDLGMTSIGDVLVRDDGIYLTCGFYGGTGYFFYGGGVYRISYDGGIETLIDPMGAQTVNFPKIYIQDTDDASILYYYSGDGYSNAGSWDSWVSDDVYQLNLETKISEPASFVLSNIGDILCMDGSVWTLTDTSGQYTEILSAELAAQLGYTDLGGHSGDGETFVSDLDLVGDTAYFTITKMTVDSSVSIGWRTGYRREPMQTYFTKLGSGEVTLLYEY